MNHFNQQEIILNTRKTLWFRTFPFRSLLFWLRTLWQSSPDFPKKAGAKLPSPILIWISFFSQTLFWQDFYLTHFLFFVFFSYVYPLFVLSNVALGIFFQNLSFFLTYLLGLLVLFLPFFSFSFILSCLLFSFQIYIFFPSYEKLVTYVNDGTSL